MFDLLFNLEIQMENRNSDFGAKIILAKIFNLDFEITLPNWNWINSPLPNWNSPLPN